jgi:hypothetical protein
MKRRFLALRIVSTIFKIVAVLALIAMIGAIAYVLLNATDFPTIESKIPLIAAALGSGLVGTILLFAIGQFLDLLMALEANTRASTAMLQQLGKVMKERL